ncbi:MAG: GntR family transcriptional regulator [Pseudomonadota bacterium]
MIQRVVLSEQVKEELLDDIMAGRYKPGDRLVESQIAKRMGISQSPVREALRDMVAMRFVEVEPHKGARVRQIDQREVLEIYPVRACLEELAGQLAVAHAGDILDDLQKSTERMTAAFEAQDVRTLAHWDVRFHRAILEASGNQILIETWNSLMIEARTFVTLNNLISRKPHINLAGRHMPIIEALQEGDPIRCGRVMREHVEEFGDVMHGIFEDGDESTTDLKPFELDMALPPLKAEAG